MTRPEKMELKPDPQFLKDYIKWLFKQNYKSELEQASIIILRDFLNSRPSRPRDWSKELLELKRILDTYSTGDMENCCFPIYSAAKDLVNLLEKES